MWRNAITTITTCFLLGTTFTHWIADHNVLWRSPLTPAALEQSIRYYALVGSGAPVLGWVYLGVGLASSLAALTKLVTGWRGQSGEVLFDGASLLLITSVAYNQATEVFPTLAAIPSPLPANLTEHEMFGPLATAVRDLANDNIITAVMLTGVMFLQAGRYAASRSGENDGPEMMPDTAPSSATSSLVPSPAMTPKPLNERHATPFRELTEAEAMELALLENNSKRTPRRSTRRK
ncbi:hypothetical protein CcaverHIS002_0106590 [Cutaneotrichosporon cavernicola]|uniref:Shr3 amino acid permease chaperone n=1 Tax=Cutaneotrichosporon cavernicola TaxID=279322 RepID=A0AA48KYU3_9TREE|nr:uncharacterized protein CcaverHIS019_0106540 [Cutaneotrichosporon cavernicola]BEI80130.1 hypothetical protein CcaverHIS002_0106590 [Cutaneotrichosporon cavernicola]BEI87936.1 hypothetical protein CcaverHIS019_0106540 [Cutaneotrichosporon cavernicola]BEI95709.1 hypothetical protein CcaverHIS631_0106580 [Cutaneotrichosporon cavernicola]BEJ03484.1 hypothetical protein CcaverHIS641_0106590 [Cutaneotrichosporon cavernicola]